MGQASSGFVVRAGQICSATEEEHVAWCVRSVLSLQRGELTRFPKLGADLQSLMFRRDSPELRQRIEQQILEAIEGGEPRVELVGTEIVSDELEPSLLSVRVKYRVRKTKRQGAIRIQL